MPSFTFVSTADAFVLRGATVVFVDIRPDTMNIDEKLIEAAITDKTKAIVPVHYAGVACEMDTILDIAKRHNLAVVEDAAQGVMSTYKGRLSVQSATTAVTRSTRQRTTAWARAEQFSLRMRTKSATPRFSVRKVPTAAVFCAVRLINILGLTTARPTCRAI